MDWCSGILATGSWDATVKVWQCNELNGYLVNIEHDFLAQLDHNSQVLGLFSLLNNHSFVRLKLPTKRLKSDYLV